MAIATAAITDNKQTLQPTALPGPCRTCKRIE
jgi:hypothetical protein